MGLSCFCLKYVIYMWLSRIYLHPHRREQIGYQRAAYTAEHKFPHKIKRNQTTVELWPHSREPKILRLHNSKSPLQGCFSKKILFQLQWKGNVCADDDDINLSSSEM